VKIYPTETSMPVPLSFELTRCDFGVDWNSKSG
jgi:hypothetical protein